MLSTLYKAFVRTALFSMDPERAHECVGGLLASASRWPALCACRRAAGLVRDGRLNVSLGSLKLENPVGIGAGFDKEGRLVPALSAIGFGFVETGTFTPEAQPGNPRPRIVRLVREEALVNAMGFNNPGGRAALENLLRARASFEARPGLTVPVGVNIGKGRETPLEKALEDYLANFERLYPVADYFVLNVSSPNTPNLRRLERAEALRPILEAVQARNKALAGGRAPRPVFVKVSPDLPETELEKLAGLLAEQGAGAIATNTAHKAAGLPAGGTLEGGLSGRPVFEASTRALRILARSSKKRIPLIGVGGVFSAEDAYEKIRAGAGAVQIYTGMIYEGPGLVREINKGLIRLLERDGFKSLQEAIGADV